MSSSVSLPNFSRKRPFTSFHLPSTWSQFIGRSFLGISPEHIIASRVPETGGALVRPHARHTSGALARRLLLYVGSGGEAMFSWALMFLVVALIAAIFGFTGIAASAAGIAKIIFVVALVLAA